ncbi:MAG: DUF1549 domain-containing protein, partial [Planctomycetota bacterium]|nr:DUF1549 domain-containing protein [Planctomycetota bacterium]
MAFQKSHPIDHLVKRGFQQDHLEYSRPAEKHTLLRRLSFDLTGLPPTREETQAFLRDDSVTAYEDQVERLLESPHFGERMAMWWLDAARYADTDGYQGDATRSNWPWRDWVVQSFNQNRPFDDFTVEQFAGDLLPNASAEQKLATCFHRNHMANGEGGRHPEESRIDYVIDRVNTLGTVWLGLTLGCTQCHSHKFDPISHHEYYGLFAFFNSIDEDGKAGGGAKPFLKYRSKYGSRDVDQAQDLVNQRKQVEARTRKQAEAEFESWYEAKRKSIPRNYTGWLTAQPAMVEAVEGTVLKIEPNHVIQASGPSRFQDDYRVVISPGEATVTGIRLDVFPHAS